MDIEIHGQQVKARKMLTTNCANKTAYKGLSCDNYRN